MLAQTKDVEFVIISDVRANSLEHCTDGRPAELGDVDRAVRPAATLAIPPYVFGMRRRLIHRLLQTQPRWRLDADLIATTQSTEYGTPFRRQSCGRSCRVNRRTKPGRPCGLPGQRLPL